MQLSILFFYIANWVGQDYYSPQALTYFLYLVVIGTCLNWFGVRKAPLSASDTRRRITDRVTALAGRFCPRDLKSDTALSESEPYQRVGLMAIIVVLSAAIVSGHQLTPLMLISATTMLVLFQQTKARGLPVVVLVLTLIWILFPAITFVDNHMEGILASIGRLTDNVHANLINLTVVSPGQRLVSLMGRGLSLLLWGVALLGGLRRLREGRWDMTGMLMAAAPIVVPMGNPYGGEILFRVFFFTLPFVAFFAAALVFPDQRAGKSWRAVATAFLLSIVLLVGFYYAHFGKERQYRFTQNEVDAAVYLYSNAPPNSLLIEGSRNYPTQFKNYEYFTYVPITREPMESRMRVIENPVETFGRWMDNPDYAATYLLITQSQKIESSVLGKLPSGSLDAVEQTLLRSGRFRVIYENKDARIFVLPDSAEGERE